MASTGGEMENLRTASLYINNQLLSRGLLRDGHSIDFANPACSEHGGLPAAMGRIMSVVNDLILKRDRDSEHRESLSSTLRNLRAETLRQTTDYTRQADRLAEAQRRVDGADAAERALRAQLKAAEATVHKMKDEAQKMKTLVAQTRSGCANEVRKRDRQIEALKKTVTDAARVRGGARSRDVVTISVTGDFGDEAGGMGPGSTADAEYSLRMETNEFLTRLARGLSEENEGLVNIVRRTVDSLREMSGLETELVGGGGSTSGKGAEELASELETIIQHLRNILTNPSFVPIEELEARDEEIARLRAGFEKMETRWKDAVRMIEGWRRRMGSGGKSVDMEELSMGLRLSPVRLRDVVVETADMGVERVHAMELSCVQEEEEEEEEEYVRPRIPAYSSPTKKGYPVTAEQSRARLPSPVEAVELAAARTSQEEVEAVPYEEEVEDSDASSIYDEDEDLLDLEEEDEAEEPNFEVLQVSTTSSASSPPMPERPQLSPLKDSFSAGNKQPSEEGQQQPPPPSRKRVGDFSAAAASASSSDGQSLNTTSDTSSRNLDDDRRREKREAVPPSRNTRLAARRSLEKSAESFEVAYESPHFGKSSEKASSELRLFSKPAAPVFVSAKPKPDTTTTTTAATTKAMKAKAIAVARAKPTPPSTQRSTRSTATPKTVTPVVVVEEVQEEKSEGPAEKKLRRSLPESEPENDVSSDSVVPPRSRTSKTAPAVPTPAGSRGRNKALQPAKPTAVAAAAAAAPSPKTSPQPAQQPRNRSPIRPQGGTRLLPPQRKKMPAVPQSPMTMEAITAKLAASEREADAARVRAKLKAARLGRRGGAVAAAATGSDVETAAAEQALSRTASPVRSQESAKKPRVRSPIKIVEPRQNDNDDDNNNNEDAEEAPRDRDMPDELASTGAADELVEPEQHQYNNNRIEVVKRKRDRLLSQATNRRASRRRSTLSSWELEGLIAGNVGPASPSK